MSSGRIASASACLLVLAASLGCAIWVSSQAEAQSPVAVSSSAETSQVRFTGEVYDGTDFDRDIGHDLVFRLTALTGDAAGGWVIEIAPKVQPADEPAEFSAIATPPYHFYNQRYLAGAYGYSTKEAVAITPRRFNFVLTVADDHIAESVVNSMLYPSAASDQEKQQIAAQAAGVNLGQGELRILKSRVRFGKAGGSDAIAYLKFEVALDFSPGLTLQQVLAPKPPSGR
jgi:hypothetical protein